MVDVMKAKLNPASVFSTPYDVLNDHTLSRLTKIDILKRWAYDEREIEVAEEENMTNVNATHEIHDHRLDEILKCLLELGVEGDQAKPSPTKQG